MNCSSHEVEKSVGKSVEMNERDTIQLKRRFLDQETVLSKNLCENGGMFVVYFYFF